MIYIHACMSTSSPLEYRFIMLVSVTGNVPSFENNYFYYYPTMMAIVFMLPANVCMQVLLCSRSPFTLFYVLIIVLFIVLFNYMFVFIFNRR